MTHHSPIQRETSIYSGGTWKAGRGTGRLAAVDPSTGRAFADLPAGNAEDVQEAAAHAAAAFPGWKAAGSARRAGFLRGFAEGLSRRRGVLVALQMRANGKPEAEAGIDLDDAVACFAYYADLAEGLDAAQDARVAHGGGAHFGLVRREPLGPAGLIVPWNFPLVTSAWKIAPALAAGCTAVLKTSEMTPLAELAYGDIAEEIGLPPGVLNIVTGGAEAGIAMTRAPDLRKISFTGSNMTGAAVMKAVAARCLPVSLELGGKSAIIVTADADIDQAVECIAGGIFFNAGQMCSATSRLIVDRAIEAPLLEALAEAARAIVTGNPFDGAEMGPITTRAQYLKVLDYLGAARAEGLDCIAGGTAPDMDGGNFIAPTIYRGVPRSSRIWTEEIFGPVLATTSVGSDAEALAVANASEFGLAGTVVSGDWERAKRLADGLEAGQVWINTPQAVYPDSAWGGFKQSGIGRELGPWGLSGYQGIKHILSPAIS
ncbi:aldehyde dehydrogenase family protein [Mangrovicoccus sp. HB161399]|uniref:aldehyde dehydrogenase family protein n=1 Tax=Mangrovicoccus sp. HB161399 TaxID=2720392 RepID=UPI0015544C9B|nr:aldehyde dehydrogenase family protein [Mangrovicoccus sp. HB161399]